MAPPTIPLRAEMTREAPDGAGAWSIPVVTLALQTLQQRVLMWLVTLGAGAIWTVAVLHPDPYRILAATLYSLTVVWPFLRRDAKGD